MAKNTHDVMINRMLANYLESVIQAKDCGGNVVDEIDAIGRTLGLCDADINLLYMSAEKRLKQLKRASKPLGNRVVDWINDINNHNNAC